MNLRYDKRASVMRKESIIMGDLNFYPHQNQALEQTEQRTKVAYYLDMGLGKTFVGAEKMKRLGGKVNMVVCQKSKIQDWIEHLKTNYSNENERFIVWDMTHKTDYEMFFKFIEHKDGQGKIVGIINYELAWRRPELGKLPLDTLMLDESSLVQNRKAKQTKFILKLQPKNVVLLSGTPTSGKYENLWTQAHLLGWNISESLYLKQYVNMEKINVPGGRIAQIVSKKKPYKNIERLKDKLRENGAVFMKTEECFELPSQTFTQIKVDASSEYRKFMKNGIVTLRGKFEYGDITEEELTLVGDTNLTKRLYARELCGPYSQAKLDAFKDLLESTNDRLIVFYNFTDEVEKLYEIAERLERPTSWINGMSKTLEAYEKYDNSVTFVQYQAGAMGLNLQKANKVIYYSLPERSELFEQSKKRIHRIGQDKPCYYYIMTCRNSVEEAVYKTLKMRRDFTDELFREVNS